MTPNVIKDEASGSADDRFAPMRGVLKGTRTTKQWLRETRGD